MSNVATPGLPTSVSEAGAHIPVRRSMSDVVHEVLTRHIRSGALAAGDVLREKSLVEVFAVGRMPVAIALNRLAEEGLGHRRDHMHGLVVGADIVGAVRPADLAGLDLQLDDGEATSLRVRNWRTLIYPQVEREVASCLLFGRFRIRSQALASHFGVSRTIANELLLRLERVGLVQQESNAHWYAGPLTPARIRDLYEMRILLEPEALRQAAPHVPRGELLEKLARVQAAAQASARSDVGLLHRLEMDLHHDVVLRGTNEEMRATLYRCQLPLITVHLSFGSYDDGSDIPAMIVSHEAVLRHLVDGEVEAAAAALAGHLRFSLDNNPSRLATLRALDPSLLSPYLDQA